MQASTQVKNGIVLGVTIIGICILFFIKPMGQNPSYHEFADQRAILSIEHFWNVVSNIPFFVVGLLGMFFMLICAALEPITSHSTTANLSAAARQA